MHMLIPLKYLALAVVLYFAMYSVMKHKRKLKWFLIFSRCALAVYVMAMLYLILLTRSPGDVREYELRLFWTYQYSLEQRAWDLFYQGILNVGMFVPLGLLIRGSCRRWKGAWHFYRVMIPAVIFAVLIESAQFVFALGLCEFDDILHNTLGAVLGSSLFTAFRGLAWKSGQLVIYWKTLLRGYLPTGLVTLGFYVFHCVMHAKWG